MISRLINDANFKLAIFCAAIFFASVSIVGIILYVDVQQSLSVQVKDRINAEMEQLLVDYRQDGINELRHDIRERIEANPTNRLRYYIQNSDGRVIFDKFDALPTTGGWHEAAGLLLRTEPLDDGYVLAIGGELTAIYDMQDIMLHGLLMSFLVSAVLAIVGGFVVSNRFLKRVDRLSRTAEMIGAGDLSQRIALTGTGDNFDQLAAAINHMLERIEQLMHEIQHVTTNIAHDLRTPLTRLRNHLETLLDQHPGINEALVLLDEALATFSALLRIAEVESGARRKGFTAVDLSALLAHLADTYEAVAEEKGIALRRHIVANITVHGDKHLLAQMFSNLIENALKYGGKEIILTLQEGYARVQDNGPGIPEAERNEILKPFYRLDKSRTTRGNGLGLSLVAAIAGLHHMPLTLSDNRPGLAVTVGFSLQA